MFDYGLFDAINTILSVLGGLSLGYLRTHYLPNTKPVSPIVQPSIPSNILPVPGPGTNKVYVRFHFQDGRIEVKKFNTSDLDLIIYWRDRKFEAGPWTSDGHIYYEDIR